MKFIDFRTSISTKMISLYLAFMIPLLLFLFFNNNYAIDVVRNQVTQSNKNLVSLYMAQIDRNLEEIDRYLYNFIISNTDIPLYELNEAGNNQEYYKAKIRLSNQISSDLNNSRADMIFIYSAVNNDLLTTQHKTAEELEKDAILIKIKTVFANSELVKQAITNKWLVYQIGDSYSICHIVRTGDVYIGAWIDTESLMVPLSLVDFGKNGLAVLTSDDFQPITQFKLDNTDQIKLNFSPEKYQLTGSRNKFLVIGDNSKFGNFGLVAIVPESVILQNLPYIQKLISIIPVLSVFVILIYLLILKKIIMNPLRLIVTSMLKLKTGDLDTRIDLHHTSREFELVNQTFNSMVTQIKELKIQVYEDKLSLQKEELKHLQMQINPHFFLNSLNVIYQLAQVHDYKLIQEMSYNLVDYFRFMFRSNQLFVSLDEEIKHTISYLKIQALRFPDHLKYIIIISDQHLACQVPPLLVQSFVENSIKHAMTLDDLLQIEIRTMMFTDEIDTKLLIQIQDNGRGFPDTLLKNLQNGHASINEKGEQVGIWNTNRRLQLLYNGRASIQYSNLDQGGACVKIYIPLNQAKK